MKKAFILCTSTHQSLEQFAKIVTIKKDLSGITQNHVKTKWEVEEYKKIKRMEKYLTIERKWNAFENRWTFNLFEIDKCFVTDDA